MERGAEMLQRVRHVGIVQEGLLLFLGREEALHDVGEFVGAEDLTFI